MNKREALIMHFKKRLYERYNIYLNIDELSEVIEEMIWNVQHGEDKVVCRISLRKTIRKIKIRKRIVYIVYDRFRKAPITCLTPEMAYEYIGNIIVNKLEDSLAYG